MKITDFFYRHAALRLAAKVIFESDTEPLIPRLWCAAVFFEQYLRLGSEGTSKDFGPKDPVILGVVSPSSDDGDMPTPVAQIHPKRPKP